MVAPGGSYTMPTLHLRFQNNRAKDTQLTKCELDISQQHRSEAVPRHQSFSQAQELAQGKGLIRKFTGCYEEDGLGTDTNH